MKVANIYIIQDETSKRYYLALGNDTETKCLPLTDAEYETRKEALRAKDRIINVIADLDSCNEDKDEKDCIECGAILPFCNCHSAFSHGS